MLTVADTYMGKKPVTDALKVQEECPVLLRREGGEKRGIYSIVSPIDTQENLDQCQEKRLYIVGAEEGGEHNMKTTKNSFPIHFSADGGNRRFLGRREDLQIAFVGKGEERKEERKEGCQVWRQMHLSQCSRKKKVPHVAPGRREKKRGA